MAIETGTNVITPLGSGQFFRWSPHGQEMALLDGGRLFVATVGLAPRRVVPWEDISGVSWSPDATRLAFGRSNHEIWQWAGMAPILASWRTVMTA